MKSTKERDKRVGKKPQRKTNGDDLRRALNWILIDDIFAHVRLHGNVKWKPLALVCLAIFWVWSSQPGLVEAAKDAITTVAKLFGSDAGPSSESFHRAHAMRGNARKILPSTAVRSSNWRRRVH